MIILNMKKPFLFLAVVSIALISCKKDTPVDETAPEVSIETQNSYDDQAAVEFLQTHYFNAKGKVEELKEGDTTNVKLANLNPITLPSGVVYVVRPGAQPDPGTTIGSSDIIRLMGVSTTYVATNETDKVKFRSPANFSNPIASSGMPEVDPSYFYVKKKVLDAGATDIQKQRSYYEIEGFKEGLMKFKSFDIPDETNYNLQGLIIVPSRAAFARDPHFNYTGISYRNRSFIFNVQVYKTTEAPDPR